MKRAKKCTFFIRDGRLSNGSEGGKIPSFNERHLEVLPAEVVVSNSAKQKDAVFRDTTLHGQRSFAYFFSTRETGSIIDR